MGRQNLPCERLQWINAACMLDFTQPVHSPGRQPKDSDVVDLNLNGPSDPGNSSPGTSPSYEMRVMTSLPPNRCGFSMPTTASTRPV